MIFNLSLSAQTFPFSVESIKLNSNSWNQTTFDITFHPKLKKQNMFYFFTIRRARVDDARVNVYSTQQSGIGLTYTVSLLKEDTWYEMDIELRDSNTTTQVGPKLAKPFLWKTEGLKDFFFW